MPTIAKKRVVNANVPSGKYQEIIKIRGVKDGPISIIIAGVHGDERCGVDIFEKIIHTIRIELGEVIFIYGNPEAIEKDCRFVESNLNRMFKKDKFLSKNEIESYEYDRAQFLKNYLNQADALLDIHASFTPKSKPFVICEANSKEIIKYLPVDLVVSGFDTVEPGGTDYYMNSIGKIGICLECGYLGNKSSLRIAEQGVFAFLKARGHILNDIKIQKQSYIRMYDLYITKTNKFSLSKKFFDFEEISKNKIIGVDGRKEVVAEKDSVILFARNTNKVGEEAFLVGEKKDRLI